MKAKIVTEKLPATPRKPKELYGPIDYFDDLKRVIGVGIHFPVWLGKLVLSAQVPKKVRLRMAFSLAYVLIPLGLRATRRPLLGHIDDLFMGLYILNYIFENVPKTVQMELWGGNEIDLEIIEDLVTEAFQFLTGRKRYLN